MNNEELLDVNEIRPEGTPLKSITYKPYFPCYVAIAAGVGFILIRQWAFIILGIIFIGLAAFVLFRVKDRKVIDIYQQGVLIYGMDDDSKGIYLNYDQISEWGAKSSQNGSECVFFVVEEGQRIYKDTFQAMAAYRELNKLIPEKESEHIRQEKLKAEPFKWSRFLDFFRKR